MPGITLYGPTGQPLAPPVPAIVEPTFGSLRVVPKPYEYAFPGTVLGHYRAYGATSAAAFSASANLLAFRFAPASSAPVAILTRLQAHVYVATAVTAQRMDPLLAIAARSYTAAETTNTTAVAVTGNNAKAKTGMGTSLASILVASAAAGVSGGTRTLDGTPFGFCPLSSNGTAITAVGTGSNAILDCYQDIDSGQHPMTFGGAAGAEGFVVQLGATAVATGTVICSFLVEWVETLLF